MGRGKQQVSKKKTQKHKNNEINSRCPEEGRARETRRVVWNCDFKKIRFQNVVYKISNF